MDAAALGTKFKVSVTPAVTESNCSGDSSTLANAGVARLKHKVAAASKFRTVSSPMLLASAISESSGDVHLHWLNPQVVTFWNCPRRLLRNFRLKRREPAVGREIGGIEGPRDRRQRYAIARFVVFSAFWTDFRCSLRRL
jgi:hypothetical protein